MLVLGSQLTKAWSKDQGGALARNSGEAELYAANKATSEGLGIASLARDWRMSLDLTLELDASATQGILERGGPGKVRHVEVEAL